MSHRSHHRTPPHQSGHSSTRPSEGVYRQYSHSVASAHPIYPAPPPPGYDYARPHPFPWTTGPTAPPPSHSHTPRDSQARTAFTGSYPSYALAPPFAAANAPNEHAQILAQLKDIQEHQSQTVALLRELVAENRRTTERLAFMENAISEQNLSKKMLEEEELRADGCSDTVYVHNAIGSNRK